ncbi:MAG: outer membrane beta-barrel protein, partial [Desulfobacterales bacterium]
MKFKTTVIVTAFTLLLTPSMIFGYQATFTPKISVGAEYTDNVFQQESNEQDEYITTMSPGFISELLGKNSGINLSYNPTYVMYDEFEENDRWRHDARLNGWAELSKNTRLDIRNRFRLTEDPLSESDIAALRAQDPDDIIDNTRRTSLRKYYRNNASVNLLHQFGEFDTFNLGYKHYFLKNDDPRYEDKERHNPYVELTYWFVHDWGFNLRGDYIKGEYDVSSDYDQINARARLLKKFSKLLDGFVQFGYATLDYDEERREDSDAYNLSAGFDYSIAKDISLLFFAGYSYLDRDISDDESSASGNVKLTK